MESIYMALKEYFERKNIKIDEFNENLDDLSIDFTELMDKSDQDITDFLKEKAVYNQDFDRWFKLLREIKIDSTINKLESESENTAEESIKASIVNLFASIIEPDTVLIEGETIKLVYNYCQDSLLNEKIKTLDSWKKENIVETLSMKFGVISENIVFIDSVTAYVEFVSSFDDINYVSRGQKDCTYDLKPSLHRIYADNYKSHASDYEDRFKQKVLFYDGSTKIKNSEELRAYGQHFGLPTNYLDFTEAHLISLLFSVEDYNYSENHAIVFFVDALSHNKETIRNEIKLVDFSNEELRNTTERVYSDKSYFIKVGNSNERIHFQKGCFLKIEPNDKLDIMFERNTKIAVIDKDSKKRILTELFNLGITFENIYPDKDNMVNTIKFIKANIE